MGHRSPARNPARYLAPIALVAFALALLIVVTSTGGGGGGGGSTSTPAASGSRTTTTGSHTTTGTTTTRTRIPRIYVIKPGDSLSIIADKTGVTVERIQELNPDVDPQALVSGERLKLRP